MKRPFFHSIWDFLGIPFRLILFDQVWLPKFGWTTLEQERIRAVLPYIKGRLLDVGAGTNLLVKTYGNGLGVDVVDWGGGAQMVEDTSKLPFESTSFDSITFIACLNHIPYRTAALREARRLIRPGGCLVISMISPLLGNIGHFIWWYSEDKHRGGMLPGELGGMTTGQIVGLCREAGFTLTAHKRFVYGLNNLYVFEPV